MGQGTTPSGKDAVRWRRRHRAVAAAFGTAFAIEARRNTPEGYRTDLDPVWAVSLTGGEPIRFERGQYPVAGDGFVLTHVANRGLVAYDIARPTDEPLLVAPDDAVDSASRWDVEGAVAVWTTPDRSVELARIERG